MDYGGNLFIPLSGFDENRDVEEDVTESDILHGDADPGPVPDARGDREGEGSF